jgi:hypothetical protein
MRISILGGTGDIGEGLCLRWAYDTDHELVIGSREPERARSKADEYETELDSRGLDRKITGFVNEMAADRGDVVILAVPPYHVRDVLENVGDKLDEDTILVTPAVGMDRDDAGLHYSPPPQGSVAALVAEHAPEDTRVVGAFHNLSADRLANLDVTLDVDTLVFGDDSDAVELVRSLAEDIEGLGTLSAGPLANAPAVESLTPLLITLGMYNDVHDLGVKFH